MITCGNKEGNVEKPKQNKRLRHIMTRNHFYTKFKQPETPTVEQLPKLITKPNQSTFKRVNQRFWYNENKCLIPEYYAFDVNNSEDENSSSAKSTKRKRKNNVFSAFKAMRPKIKNRMGSTYSFKSKDDKKNIIDKRKAIKTLFNLDPRASMIDDEKIAQRLKNFQSLGWAFESSSSLKQNNFNETIKQLQKANKRLIIKTPSVNYKSYLT